MDLPCPYCHGGRDIQCSACLGRGYTQRLTSSGDMDISPCAVCAGRRRVPCPQCRGTGRMTVPGAAPPAPTGARTTEPLEGRWYDGQGGYFEFTRAGDSYRLEEVGVLGKVGEGKADLVGDLVRIHSRNRLLGDYSMELRRSGETLSGHFRMLGMALPFTLTRR